MAKLTANQASHRDARYTENPDKKLRDACLNWHRNNRLCTTFKWSEEALERYQEHLRSKLPRDGVVSQKTAQHAAPALIDVSARPPFMRFPDERSKHEHDIDHVNWLLEFELKQYRDKLPTVPINATPAEEAAISEQRRAFMVEQEADWKKRYCLPALSSRVPSMEEEWTKEEQERESCRKSWLEFEATKQDHLVKGQHINALNALLPKYKAEERRRANHRWWIQHSVFSGEQIPNDLLCLSADEVVSATRDAQKLLEKRKRQPGMIKRLKEDRQQARRDARRKPRSIGNCVVGPVLNEDMRNVHNLGKSHRCHTNLKRSELLRKYRLEKYVSLVFTTFTEAFNTEMMGIFEKDLVSKNESEEDYERIKQRHLAQEKAEQEERDRVWQEKRDAEERDITNKKRNERAHDLAKREGAKTSELLELLGMTGGDIWPHLHMPIFDGDDDYDVDNADNTLHELESILEQLDALGPKIVSTGERRRRFIDLHGSDALPDFVEEPYDVCDFERYLDEYVAELDNATPQAVDDTPPSAQLTVDNTPSFEHCDALLQTMKQKKADEPMSGEAEVHPECMWEDPELDRVREGARKLESELREPITAPAGSETSVRWWEPHIVRVRARLEEKKNEAREMEEIEDGMKRPAMQQMLETNKQANKRRKRAKPAKAADGAKRQKHEGVISDACQ